MARPEGFEPPTLCLEGRCSIRLSYGRVTCFVNPNTELISVVFLLSEPNRKRLGLAKATITVMGSSKNDGGS